MTIHNQAEIISIGTEILMGEIIDTNTSYIATELRLLGNMPVRVTAVGDDRVQLRQVLRQAFERSDVIITSGGLGPTEDDLTRECLADVLGESLAVDRALEDGLRKLFERLGIEMPSHNIKQAMLIPSAAPVTNHNGTAPGWWIEKDGKTIVTLPGPPRELKPMWESEVRPKLQSIFPSSAILTRTLKTFGLSEAKVAEMVMPLCSTDNPALGIYAQHDGIHLRIISHGEYPKDLLEDTQIRLESILDGHIWGRGNDTLPAVVGKLLMEKNLSLATMEEGTRGFIASTIASDDNASKYYRGGLVVTSHDMQNGSGILPELVNKFGAVSAEVAKTMADIAKKQFSADFGLSITGIMGLDKSVSQAPGLAFVGIADGQGKASWRQRNLYFIDIIRERAAIAALFRLRQKLLDI